MEGRFCPKHCSCLATVIKIAFLSGALNPGASLSCEHSRRRDETPPSPSCLRSGPGILCHRDTSFEGIPFHDLKFHSIIFFLSKGEGETPIDWRQKRDAPSYTPTMLSLMFNGLDRDRDRTISAEELSMDMVGNVHTGQHQPTPKEAKLLQGMGHVVARHLYLRCMYDVFVYIWFSHLVDLLDSNN